MYMKMGFWGICGQQIPRLACTSAVWLVFFCLFIEPFDIEDYNGKHQGPDQRGRCAGLSGPSVLAYAWRPLLT